MKAIQCKDSRYTLVRLDFVRSDELNEDQAVMASVLPFVRGVDFSRTQFKVRKGTNTMNTHFHMELSYLPPPHSPIHVLYCPPLNTHPLPTDSRVIK